MVPPERLARGPLCRGRIDQPAPAALLTDVRDAIARERGARLAHRIAPASVPGWSTIEIYVGENALAMSDMQIVAVYAELIHRAQTTGR